MSPLFHCYYAATLFERTKKQEAGDVMSLFVDFYVQEVAACHCYVDESVNHHIRAWHRCFEEYLQSLREHLQTNIYERRIQSINSTWSRHGVV